MKLSTIVAKAIPRTHIALYRRTVVVLTPV
jgi:hypothetical protein